MTLHFDCFAGISGDMTLGALTGLGVKPEFLRDELKKLPISGWALDFVEDSRCGISGLRAVVEETGGAARHEHAHTHWSEIRSLIEASAISEGAKKRAIAIFSVIAAAEAAVHNTSIADVAFHEVGAIDSIIDITGTAICLDVLKPGRITASEVELGGGSVQCAHGILPVPAPATLRLCANMPVRCGGFDKEMTTPTGAGILAASVDEFVMAARWREVKTAYGIGGRQFDKPNVLRVSLREECAEYAEEGLFALEANIDDMTGESFGFLMERLFEAGALDVTFTPCVMKKSRPATTVFILSAPPERTALRELMFKHSTTIGLREYPVTRYALPRKIEPVKADGEIVQIKTVSLGNSQRSKIEYEDRARIARKRDISLDEAAAALQSRS